MADPISLAASIVAFIEITDRVIRTVKHCIDAVKDAPRDMQMILGEVTSLRTIMDSLSVANSISGSDPDLLQKTGPIEACRRCLVSLEALLPPLESSKINPNGRRRITFAEHAWPLKESKARKLLAEISLHKSTLLLAITGGMVEDVREIKSGIDRVEQTLTEAQRQEVYKWLETTNPSQLHNLAVKNHERETGTWLLRLPEWNNWLWRRQSTRLLWLHGIPGAGKTVLASFLIEELKDHCAYSDEVGQAYYYCHYAHNEDEAAPFLRWIVSQTCRRARWVPRQLSELHRMGCDPSISELEDALEAVLTRFKMFYITIDAIDESCPREDLLAVIRTLAVDKRFANLSIFVTSRPYFDIECALKDISVNVSMSNTAVEADIRRMVHSRLHSSRRMKKFPHLLETIVDALVSGAQGMFRWAHCQLYNIEQLRDESQILSAIKSLPKDLAETYRRGLSDIPDSDRAFVRRVFIWICGHAQAPWLTQRGITAGVLLSAVSYDLSLNPGTYTLDDLKELCGCLIDVSVDSPSKGTQDEEYYESSGKPRPRNAHLPSKYELSNETTPGIDSDLLVSLAHYTVSEFLQSSIILETNVAAFSLPPTTTTIEFTESVLRQALQCDPTSSATDWVVDREAYCLTLACAIYRDTIEKVRPEILDLFLEYHNPSKPHYRRIQQIQQRLLESRDKEARHYFIQYLPTKVLLVSTMEQAPEWLATALNIWMVSPYAGISHGLMARCLAPRTAEELQQLSSAVLVASFLTFSLFNERLGMAREVTFQGTVGDIVKQAHSGTGMFGGASYYTYSMAGDSEEGEAGSETMSVGEDDHWPFPVRISGAGASENLS